MIALTADQRTPEWWAARLGRLTGSRAADMLATIKSGGEAAARRDLRLALVLERLTGQADDSGYVSAEMQRGIDLEPEALLAYEALTGHLIEPVGFLAHDTLLAGGSPDGQVGGFEGILEVKCPKSATHLSYVRDGGVPKAHLAQVTHNLWISGAAWCDFLSFDDRFPEALQTHLVRVHRRDVDLKAYELVVRLFLDEVDRELAALLSAPAKKSA